MLAESRPILVVKVPLGSASALMERGRKVLGDSGFVYRARWRTETREAAAGRSLPTRVFLVAKMAGGVREAVPGRN